VAYLGAWVVPEVASAMEVAMALVEVLVADVVVPVVHSAWVISVAVVVD
jgi:hypothetical protein